MRRGAQLHVSGIKVHGGLLQKPDRTNANASKGKVVQAPRPYTRAMPRRAVVILAVLLAGCNQGRPSPEAVYAPYRESHRWVYTVERTGLGATYRDRITLETQPQTNGTTVLRVHLLPDATDPKVGARQQYLLDWRQSPPSLRSLRTEGGRATLEPGFPLPALGPSSGEGKAAYEGGFGFLKNRSFRFSWKYEPQASQRVQTALGDLHAARTDLEFRTSYRITNANMRLDFAPTYGLVRAEWKTIYGTTTVFTLASFDGRAQ